MGQDTLTIEILPDGRIRTSTDAVSTANHSNAEQFLRYLAELTGGESIRTRRKDAHTHERVGQAVAEHSH